MTIEQANAYFASLPEGFAPARQLQEALSAKQAVDYLGVAVRLAKPPLPPSRRRCSGCRPRYRQLPMPTLWWNCIGRCKDQDNTTDSNITFRSIPESGRPN